MRITRVRATNFRAISEVDLELGPLTVVIGPNGAGKSTLLDVLHLFSGIESPDYFNNSFPRWGGYFATARYGAVDAALSIGVRVQNADTCLNYDVNFAGETSGCFVRSETLTRGDDDGKAAEQLLTRTDARVEFLAKDGKVQASRWQHGPQISLPALRANMPVADEFVATAKRTSLWQVHRFQPNQVVRAPQQLQPTRLPSPDGTNLFSAIYGLKTERRRTYADFLEALQRAVPELEELEFPLAGAGHVNMTWKQSNFSQPFYSNQLSDGVLRLVWLLTVLYSVPDDGLVLLDEPELSLHPQWLLLLVSLLRKTSARTNLVVATQSAELVRWLEPSELVIAELAESGTTFHRATDHPNLDKWLKDFSLSELWTMGELGGRR